MEPGRLVCSRCGSIPEESKVIRWVVIGYGLGAVLHFVLIRLGIAGQGWLRETTMTGSFVMALGYFTTKIAQKLRDPARPVFDETVAAFSDRLGRLILVALTIGAAWFAIPSLYLIAIGTRLKPGAEEPGWYTWYREIRVFLAIAVCLWGVAAVLRQGPRFFDPRVRSTYENRRV
jgi:hypothetical protein